MITEVSLWVGLVAQVVTLVACVFLFCELRQTKELFRIQFEDSLNREYRELARTIPIGAMLGEDLPDEQIADSLKLFFSYFDLSNEQAYLFENGRVSKVVWKNWEEGIRDNMKLPAFVKAWEKVTPKVPLSFEALKRILSNSATGAV